ncbi:MAG: hypothetical protein JO303_06625 [Caulobacteraceae bacterium]|nr:hypothetical protein [Caulobacteraceae bacterium]
MLQTLLALAFVLAAAAWLGWRALRPLLARAGGVTPRADGCACASDKVCKPKAF